MDRREEDFPVRHVERLHGHLRGMVTRGRVISATLNPKRCLLQLNGLKSEIKQKVELFLPKGMSAFPSGNEDLILLQVGNSRAHLVALLADDPALRIQDLQAGEFGFRDANGQQVVFRKDRLEVTTPLKLVANVTGDADVTVGGQVNLNVTGKVVGQASEWDLTGDVKVTGKITATGEGTFNGGHTVSQHTHSDPQGGNVGLPTG